MLYLAGLAAALLAWDRVGAEETAELPPVAPAPSSAPVPAVPVPPAPPAAPAPPPALDPTPVSTDRAVRAVSGTGMYVWRWDRTGPVPDVVRRAKENGIDFLIVRASDATNDFYLGPILAELLPAAHAAGIKVVAYDPPRFEDIEGDVRRARLLAEFRAPGGHSIDAFAADIEPKWHLLTPQAADLYGRRLREVLGPDYPMIAVVFPPNHVGNRVPFVEIARYFDVMSPMSYWRARTLDAPGFMAASVQTLAAYGRPITAIGQAFSYDGLRDPARRGHPPREEFEAATRAAREAGAIGISWWVWEHAEPWVFDSIRESGWLGDARPGFGIPEPTPAPTAPPEVAEDAAPVAIGPPAMAFPDRTPAHARAMALLLVSAAMLGSVRAARLGAWRPATERLIIAAERAVAPLVAEQCRRVRRTLSRR